MSVYRLLPGTFLTGLCEPKHKTLTGTYIVISCFVVYKSVNSDGIPRLTALDLHPQKRKSVAKQDGTHYFTWSTGAAAAVSCAAAVISIVNKPNYFAIISYGTVIREFRSSCCPSCFLGGGRPDPSSSKAGSDRTISGPSLDRWRLRGVVARCARA